MAEYKIDLGFKELSFHFITEARIEVCLPVSSHVTILLENFSVLLLSRNKSSWQKVC